ncbi:MAG: hypothetical protein PHI31_04360 [Desulfuromonadaceae bacterium]|nr:hypothetical protein [Desulfuromonadaceae bacterium]
MSAESRLAITLTSTATNPARLCLKNSRKYRLTRFLTTAHPIFLLAVIPSRAEGRLLSLQTTRKPFTVFLCCAEASRINSARFRKRTDFGNVAEMPTITQEADLFCSNSYRQAFATLSSSALDH